MDDEVVRLRLEKLGEYLSRLEGLRSLSRSEFLSDWRSQDAVLRNLQTSIEACLDLGHHIIAASGWKTPETYAAIVRILASHGVLPETFVATGEAMARFRNVLVHGYAVIRMDRVYDDLQSIDNIRQFAQYVVEFIQGRQEP